MDAIVLIVSRCRVLTHVIDVVLFIYSYYDGICSYSCYDEENVIIKNLDTDVTIWSDDGQYGSGTEIYFYVNEDGEVEWTSPNEDGSDPTDPPINTYDPTTDPDYPGEWPSASDEIMINIQ